MPAWRLDGEDRFVERYDVGASDGEKTNFVGHVLLCDVAERTKVNAASSTVPAAHMRPPLEVQESEPIDIDIVGTVHLNTGDGNRGERKQIQCFVDDRLLEQNAQKIRREKLGRSLSSQSEYILHPAAKEPDADFPLWRFNCAGFVLNAYLAANIELVALEHVPLVALAFLQENYPDIARLLERSEFREKMGIGVGDHWPVIMAGYVVNSLNRSVNEIRNAPHTPRSGDEFFPASLAVDKGDETSSS